MIYLDHNATSFLLPEILSSLKDNFLLPLNPSSVHNYGRFAKSMIEDARKKLSNFLSIDVNEYDITFTSSGTESNNMILNSFRQDQIFVSAIEHMSVLRYCQNLSTANIIKIDSTGIVDLQDLETKLSRTSVGGQKLISIMMANNETGILQPIPAIIKLAREYKALVHSDMAQVPGKIDIKFSDLDLDFATISGHKFGALTGVGALIHKKMHHLTPLIFGGGQEKGLRSGTENSMAIFSIGLAAQIHSSNITKNINYTKKLQHKLETQVNLLHDVQIIGQKQARLPNTSLIVNTKTNMSSQMQVIALDLKGIAVSSGSACSSGKVTKSYVLEAMGLEPSALEKGIRVSTSSATTEDEIDKFLAIYKTAI